MTKEDILLVRTDTPSGAVFSNCGKYRYVLWRSWNDPSDLFQSIRPFVTFIGLNPSTANQNIDDATIRRVIRFAKSWGYGGVYMMNLFGLVSRYPQELLRCEDPLGENDQWLEAMKKTGTDIVFAWGTFSVAKDRALTVAKMFDHATCLGINADGSPKHPLYVAKKSLQINFK